ncbi:hypothetical protein O9649_06335 [Achromobacter dolens]|uniref:hypothetical protein n=1 Tax=Achromobacter dolens TaxID=1287738 RepID=UPI0022B86CCE|nr:hypothetical protein [Achromobacter dolens]MCZ8407404.1 hypothetical protein [Achromobacter dolens]
MLDKHAYIEQGNFKRWVRFLLSSVGIVLLYSGIRYDSYLVILLGFLIGGVGMYASKAAMLGIKPFSDNPTLAPKQEKSE